MSGMKAIHYFVHILADIERIRDPDGAVYPGLSAATEEAQQSAREFVAGELVAGRAMPFGSCMQVEDDHGAIHATIRFAALFHGDQELPDERRGHYPLVAGTEIMRRARATMLKANKANADIRQGLIELSSRVKSLANVNAALGRR